MKDTPEKYLKLDRKNFDEHISEIEKIFGNDVDKKSPVFELLWVSSGGINYRMKPFGPVFKDKISDRYLVSEYIDDNKIYAKPSFFLRTHYDKGFCLLIECISEYQLKRWEKASIENEKYFRFERYQGELDRRFFEASDHAYIRFSLKRRRLNNDQLAKLQKSIEKLFSVSSVPKGEHDTNTYDVQRLKNSITAMLIPKKIRVK